MTIQTVLDKFIIIKQFVKLTYIEFYNSHYVLYLLPVLRVRTVCHVLNPCFCLTLRFEGQVSHLI